MDLVLLELLACPACGGKLLYDQQDQQLLCRLDCVAFTIQQGVPIMKLKHVVRSL